MDTEQLTCPDCGCTSTLEDFRDTTNKLLIEKQNDEKWSDALKRNVHPLAIKSNRNSRIMVALLHIAAAGVTIGSLLLLYTGNLAILYLSLLFVPTIIFMIASVIIVVLESGYQEIYFRNE